MWKVRDALPQSSRHKLRRAMDPLLGSVGSVVGVEPDRLESPAMAVTLDDGPDPVATPLVLDALAEAGATATFFVLIDQAVRHPEIVRRAVAEGHEIGLHGIDHRRLTTLAHGEVLGNLRTGKAQLEEIAGTRVRWFRPPFGSQSASSYLAARRVGLMPVVWTAEGHDWETQTPEAIAERVLDRVQSGGVLLLHDGLAGDPREPDLVDEIREDRGRMVALILAGMRLQGVPATSVGDLVDGVRARRTAWFRP
jgi:peptidoglycan/xylan/chitin deacetylase (PgdA/CDA1 family)